MKIVKPVEKKWEKSVLTIATPQIKYEVFSVIIAILLWVL
jgi:hypothetical protein